MSRFVLSITSARSSWTATGRDGKEAADRLLKEKLVIRFPWSSAQRLGEQQPVQHRGRARGVGGGQEQTVMVGAFLLRLSGSSTDVPLRPAPQRIFLQHEVALAALPLESQSVQPAFLGEVQRSLGGRSLRAEDHELYLSPVHLCGALRQSDVRDRRAILDQNHHGHLPRPYRMPPGTLIHLSGLIVDPPPRGQVDIPDRGVHHQRSDQDVLTKHILVLYEPGGSILWILEEQGAQHRIAFLRAELGLGVDVGNQSVPKFHRAPEVLHELLAVLPRLLGRPAVTAAVRAEYSEGQPPAVQPLRALMGEASDEVAPERETAQA